MTRLSRIRDRRLLAAAAAVLLIPSATAVAADAASVRVFLTARDTADRLAEKAPATFQPLEQPDEHVPAVMIDPAKAFQTIEGFGGALTDAAAETWAKLPAERQRELILAYFDRDKGLGYSLCRTHIHSCDFSSESYAYTEVAGDTKLEPGLYLVRLRQGNDIRTARVVVTP